MNGKPGVLAVLARDSQNSAKFSIANEHLYEPGQRITEYAESLEARATVERLAEAVSNYQSAKRQTENVRKGARVNPAYRSACQTAYAKAEEEMAAALAAFRGDG